MALFEPRRRPGSFVCYDPTDGSVALDTVKHDGTMSLRKQHTGLSQTWSMMKSCGIVNRQLTNLMFYDQAAGVGEFYFIDRNYDLSLFFSHDSWRHTWSIIAPANFVDGTGQDLLFYDRGAGTGELYVARGNTLATALLPTCEADYRALCEYFGMGSDDLPFDVYVISGHNGAYHGLCDDSEIHVEAFDGNDPDLARMLLVSEADEVFEADIDNGWDCGASNGEGLSRVLAAHRYPQSMGGGWRSGSSWIWGPRHNWVNYNDGSDTHYESIGCATLFIHYLKFQLGYSLEQITQADGDTLADKYETLTGRTDAFVPFVKAIERRFDRAVPEPFDSDNAFPIYRDLLFYGAGSGQFYSTDINTDLTFVASDDTWRTSWFVIAPANFTSRSYHDLLFYDRGAGTGELYRSDGHGHIHLLASHTNWRTTWDIIVPARFGKHRYDGILFYDSAAGTGEIYATDGHGNLQQMSSHTDWRTTWKTILPGSFTQNRYPDLLFYDPQAGVIGVFMTDREGNLELVETTPNVSKRWSLGLTCNVTGGEFSDVMFYDASGEQIEFFKTYGDGTFESVSGPQSFPGFWSQIRHTAFGEFLFYDPKQGRGEYHRASAAGHLSLLARHDDWRSSWSLIVPGTYT